MKSKTIKFNWYNLLVTLSLIVATYTVYPGLPQIVYAILAFAGMFISELLTYQSPSGQWAWDGKDWSVGKWIYRVGNSILVILAFTADQGLFLQVISLSTPLIEIIIRRYGSSTESQKLAANSTPTLTLRRG